MGSVEQFIKVSGHVRVTIENTITGEVREHEYNNICTNALLNKIAQWLSGVNNTGQNPAAVPSRFQLGTGSGTPAKTDTGLFTPYGASVVTIAAASSSGGQTSYTINYPQNSIVGTFTEGGLMDANSTLLTHLMLSPAVQVVANEAVTFTYILTLNAQ